MDNMWILCQGCLKEITGEDETFFLYEIIAGNNTGGIGAVNKRLLKHVCQNGIQKIINNPLEAYAWECVIKSDGKK